MKKGLVIQASFLNQPKQRFAPFSPTNNDHIKGQRHQRHVDSQDEVFT
jgi:hypothetical protein